MKIRTDFVTNSSSSGFVVINVKSKTLSKIFNEFGLSLDMLKEIEDYYGGETGNPWLITDSVANTICRFLENAKESECCEEVDEETLEQLIEKIEDTKEAIDTDAEADIESAEAVSDAGAPNFTYAHLEVKKGKGTFIEYTVDESCNEGTPSAFCEWAIEHGYYDPEYKDTDEYEEGFDEDLYFSPPYDEIADTYEGVRRVKIGDDK